MFNRGYRPIERINYLGWWNVSDGPLDTQSILTNELNREYDQMDKKQESMD